MPISPPFSWLNAKRHAPETGPPRHRGRFLCVDPPTFELKPATLAPVPKRGCMRQPISERRFKNERQRLQDHRTGGCTSDKSWEEAAARAVEMAGKNLRDLRVAEVTKMDRCPSKTAKTSLVLRYRARVALSFKYEE